MLCVDTMERFHQLRASLASVYITSATRGRVPVPTTILVRRELVVANDYNPNHVSEDKMRLLEQSVLDNGFCFPVVTIWDDELGKFVIVDGFHRSTIAGPEWLDFDYLPVVVLAHNIAQRMAATVQFNKARGVHQVDLDADVVRSLLEQGLNEEDVATKLGIDLDTVHRYKQLTGIASLFSGTEYSTAWRMVEDT